MLPLCRIVPRILLFQRLQCTIDKNVRLLRNLEITQVALSDMQRHNTQFASQSEDALRFFYVFLPGNFYHLGECSQRKCMRRLCTHQPLARPEAIGSIAVRRNKISLVALQSSNCIAVCQTNSNVSTDNVLSNKRTYSVVNKNYCIRFLYCLT